MFKLRVTAATLGIVTLSFSPVIN